MQCVEVREVAGEIEERPVKRTAANHHYIPALCLDADAIGPDGRACFGKPVVYDTFEDGAIAAGPFEDIKGAREKAEELNGAEFLRVKAEAERAAVEAATSPEQRRRDAGVAR